MNRTLAALLAVQSLLLTFLVVDRLTPEAQASSVSACEITNWPDTLANPFTAQPIKVKIEEVRPTVKVSVVDVSTSDTLRVNLADVSTSDRVSVAVKDWDTYDTVKVESR